MDFDTGEHALRMHISAGHGSYTGISGVQLSAGDQAQFAIGIAESGAHLQTRATIDRGAGTSYVTPLQTDGDAQLLSRELDILGHDRVYEQALDYYLGL